MLFAREICNVDPEESATGPLLTVRPAASPELGARTPPLSTVTDPALTVPLPVALTLPLSMAAFWTITAPVVVMEPPEAMARVAAANPVPTFTLLVPEIDPLTTTVPAFTLVTPP